MLTGEGLIDLLVDLTGMDRKTLEAELSIIINRLGFRVDSLTTDELRVVVAHYLEKLSPLENPEEAARMAGDLKVDKNTQADLEIVLAEA